MSGEDLISYQIRLARKMQPYSKTWKGVELARIAADGEAFAIALDGIRADCLKAGLDPVGMEPGVYREIKTVTAGGHHVSEFVGSQSIFKTMSRPARRVLSIGADARYGEYGRSSAGQVYAAKQN